MVFFVPLSQRAFTYASCFGRNRTFHSEQHCSSRCHGYLVGIYKLERRSGPALSSLGRAKERLLQKWHFQEKSLTSERFIRQKNSIWYGYFAHWTRFQIINQFPLFCLLPAVHRIPADKRNRESKSGIEIGNRLQYKFKKMPLENQYSSTEPSHTRVQYCTYSQLSEKGPVSIFLTQRVYCEQTAFWGLLNKISSKILVWNSRMEFSCGFQIIAYFTPYFLTVFSCLFSDSL